MLRSKLDQTDEIGDSWNSLPPKSNILPNKQANKYSQFCFFLGPMQTEFAAHGGLGLVTYVWHPAHSFLQINFPFQASLSQQ